MRYLKKFIFSSYEKQYTSHEKKLPHELISKDRKKIDSCISGGVFLGKFFLFLFSLFGLLFALLGKKSVDYEKKVCFIMDDSIYRRL